MQLSVQCNFAILRPDLADRNKLPPFLLCPT